MTVFGFCNDGKCVVISIIKFGKENAYTLFLEEQEGSKLS